MCPCRIYTLQLRPKNVKKENINRFLKILFSRTSSPCRAPSQFSTQLQDSVWLGKFLNVECECKKVPVCGEKFSLAFSSDAVCGLLEPETTNEMIASVREISGVLVFLRRNFKHDPGGKVVKMCSFNPALHSVAVKKLWASAAQQILCWTIAVCCRSHDKTNASLNSKNLSGVWPWSSRCALFIFISIILFVWFLLHWQDYNQT